MAELVEYCLALMVSTLLVAGSVEEYGNYTSFESGLALRAEFDAISGLALKAAENGSASMTMSVPSSTVACHRGVITVSAGGASLEESLPVACAFTAGIPTGTHTFAFKDSSTVLLLAVT